MVTFELLVAVQAHLIGRTTPSAIFATAVRHPSIRHHTLKMHSMLMLYSNQLSIMRVCCTLGTALQVGRMTAWRVAATCVWTVNLRIYYQCSMGNTLIPTQHILGQNWLCVSQNCTFFVMSLCVHCPEAHIDTIFYSDRCRTEGTFPVHDKKLPLA